MDNGIELTGLEKLVDKLERMGKQGDKIQNKALEKAGQLVLSSMVIPERTGKGKSYIKLSKVKTDENGKYINIGLDKSDTSKAFYLKFQNWGYHLRDGSFKSGTHFIENALLKNRKTVLEILKKEFEEGIKND